MQTNRAFVKRALEAQLNQDKNDTAGDSRKRHDITPNLGACLLKRQRDGEAEEISAEHSFTALGCEPATQVPRPAAVRRRPTRWPRLRRSDRRYRSPYPPTVALARARRRQFAKWCLAIRYFDRAAKPAPVDRAADPAPVVHRLRR